MTTRSRRRSGGWWAWWCAPVGGGSRRRPVRRSSDGWPTWWYAAEPPRERVRGGKGTCPLCRKGAACRCRMTKGEPIRRPRRPRGAPPYTSPADFRAQGVLWCGGCRHRINISTGRCTNTHCPR